MNEKLLRSIRKNPALYNPSFPMHKDHYARSVAWEQIAETMNISVGECKSRWNKLRKCYSNALKRRSTKNCEVGKEMPPWKYETEMSFLKPYLKGHHNDAKNDSKSADLISSESDSDDSIHSNNFLSVSYQANDSKSFLRDNNVEMAEAIQIIKMSMQQTVDQIDETDLFFLSMSQTIKKFPKLEQNRLMMEIHKCVQEAVLRYL